MQARLLQSYGQAWPRVLTAAGLAFAGLARTAGDGNVAEHVFNLEILKADVTGLFFARPPEGAAEDDHARQAAGAAPPNGGLVKKRAPPRNALQRLADRLPRTGYASLRVGRVGHGASKPWAGWTGGYRGEAEVADEYILLFPDKRTTGREPDSADHLQGTAKRFDTRRAKGQEIALLNNPLENRPAPGFAREAPSADPVASDSMMKPQLIPSEAIENLYRVGQDLFSGGEPKGEPAFAQLAALGVKTIVSVDGAIPDVDRARRHGLRYVHLPLGYNRFSTEACLRLAKAAATLPGPVFVHCHHGKHRGPTAAAIMAMTREGWTRDQAERWLTQAGTSTNYSGLYATVRDWQRPGADALTGVSSDFPEIARTSDLVRAMVEVDRAWDHLKAIAEAGFQAPPDQPDLVPLREAQRLAERLAESQQHAERAQADADLRQRLDEAARQARALARLLAADPLPSESLRRQFKIVAQSCTDCHRAYRD